MKAKFASRHEIIDIPHEGDGWSFVNPKRLYTFHYPKIEDCPKPDPNDVNDALGSAIYLESAVTGMNLGVGVKCEYKCRTRDGFCIHCKCAAPVPMIAAPARANGSNLEIIADTGSEEDLISNSDLEVHFKERAKQIPSNAVNLITANGPVEADSKHEVHVEALDQPLQFVLLPNTPAVGSVGKKCMEQGFHSFGRRVRSRISSARTAAKYNASSEATFPCLATEDHYLHVQQRHPNLRIVAGLRRLQ